MGFVSVVKKWHRLLPTGVMETAFTMKAYADEPRGLPTPPEELVYDPEQRLFLENIRILRSRYSFAYVLTNRRLEPGKPEEPPGALDADVLTSRPHGRLPFDYFYSGPLELLHSGQASLVISFSREDIVKMIDELLGRSPPPLYAALLLSTEDGLEDWVATATSRARTRDEWESLVLDRFQVLVWVHEGNLLVVKTKDASLAESLGHDPKQV